VALPGIEAFAKAFNPFNPGRAMLVGGDGISVETFLVRQAKLGASCRVQVPVGRGIRKISRKG
jgi:hypothetical protein